jgi:hypothetical protein
MSESSSASLNKVHQLEAAAATSVNPFAGGEIQPVGTLGGVGW